MLSEQPEQARRQWMHLVIDDGGIVRGAFVSFRYFEAAALAKRTRAQIETVHGFLPAVGSAFAERQL